MQGQAPKIIQGDRALAQELAAYMFEHDEAAKILEDISETGYTGRVYTIARDEAGHRREILLYRISTIGPKPQAPIKSAGHEFN